MKVIKFGGSSLASATQLEKVYNIVKNDPERKFVIVSAPGKRKPADEKVTDLLIDYAGSYLTGQDVTFLQKKIGARYLSIIEELNLDHSVFVKIQKNIDQLATMSKADPDHVMDAFKASGENNNAHLVAAFFNHKGLAAKYISPKEAGILVSNEPGNARILPSSYEKIYSLRDLDKIAVIPGFFGYTENSEICTFSRGGSDITGAIIAAGIKADLYENFTDVDAIYSAHPGIVKNPKEIKQLTYREMRELAYAGFSVFHDEALVPAFRAGIPVRIKNTNNPEAQGTLITKKRTYHDSSVIGIASDSGFVSIHISKFLMNREIGFGRKVLSILEQMCLSYEHTPSGIDDITIVLRERQLTADTETELLNRLQNELDLDEISITHDLSIIMLVGEGMKSCIGVAAKGTQALAENHINLEMINQGSSEVGIMFGIKSTDEKQAIRALYHAFFK